jgi:hypothetical protein
MGNIVVLEELTAAQPIRLRDTVRARVLGASLDEALAAGAAPESSRLLAARARDIVSLRRRLTAAGNWENLLQRARAQQLRPARLYAPGGAVPVRADEIVAAEPLIRDLMSKLTVPLPVAARGVAMARVLLTNASSPVYNWRPRVTLTAAVTEAVAQLDPALPLLPASAH